MSRQHSTFMWYSILKQESDLDIEIHRKHPLRQKIFSFGRISDDPLCRVSIKFNDLWDHLVSQTQEGTKCRLIFVSIALSLLRVIQQISKWNSPMEFQDCNSGLSLRYAIFLQYVECRLKSRRRPMTANLVPWLHKLKAWWRIWTGFSLFCVVSALQEMLLG